MGDGGVSVHGGFCPVAARFALRLACAVPAGGKIRVQHHNAENLVDGPGKRPVARFRPGLSAAGAHLENCPLDGRLVVVLGLGRVARVSISDAGACAGSDSATVQQVHAAAGKQSARAAAGAGEADPVPRAKHPVDGRQQTLAAFERVLHRVSDGSGKSCCSTRWSSN